MTDEAKVDGEATAATTATTTTTTTTTTAATLGDSRGATRAVEVRQRGRKEENRTLIPLYIIRTTNIFY